MFLNDLKNRLQPHAVPTIFGNATTFEEPATYEEHKTVELIPCWETADTLMFIGPKNHFKEETIDPLANNFKGHEGRNLTKEHTSVQPMHQLLLALNILCD